MASIMGVGKEMDAAAAASLGSANDHTNDGRMIDTDDGCVAAPSLESANDHTPQHTRSSGEPSHCYGCLPATLMPLALLFKSTIV
eukprot:1154707-Pelagomonas_calceolata.AAC.4